MDWVSQGLPCETSSYMFPNAHVIVLISDRELPERPEIQGDNGEIAPSDELWVTISSCWAEDPRGRPSALTLQRKLEKAAQVDQYSSNETLRN